MVLNPDYSRGFKHGSTLYKKGLVVLIQGSHIHQCMTRGLSIESSRRNCKGYPGYNCLSLCSHGTKVLEQVAKRIHNIATGLLLLPSGSWIIPTDLIAMLSQSFSWGSFTF